MESAGGGGCETHLLLSNSLQLIHVTVDSRPPRHSPSWKEGLELLRVHQRWGDVLRQDKLANAGDSL